MMKAMTKALLEGHEVRIPGFGIFRVRERPAIKNKFLPWYGHGFADYPAKKKVYFKPSKALLRYINA